MSSKKTVIKNRPRSEAENIDAAVPVFTEGASKPGIHQYRRGEDVSLRDEEIKHISVGIQDIDEAVLYYFKEVIRPYVINEGTTYAVPVVYADPEKWKSAQKDGYYRDKEGRVMFPVITIKRENLEKVRNITNKLDGNRPNIYQVYEKKYTKENQYDNFSVLTNRAPKKEYYNIVVPDYYKVTYSCAIYVSFMPDLNKLIESIGYRSDSYWGLPNRFLFKANIDSFPITNQVTDGEDRRIVSTFTLTMNGYITPNNLDKQLTTMPIRSIGRTKFIFTAETLDTIQAPTKKDVSLAATSFIPEGVSVYNNNYYVVSISNELIAYLNTNVAKKADFMTANTAAFYSSSFLTPPSGSGIPSASLSDFKFFANGVFIPPQHIISFLSSGSALVVTVDTGSLNYGLDNQDEIVGIGKFA